MGLLSALLGGLGSLISSGGGGNSSGKAARKQYRQDTGRYGKKGQYRKERNGDRVGRNSSGKYTRK